MPTRKLSVKEEAKWQLEVLQTFLESRTITIESITQIAWLMIVFSLGGITSSLVSGSPLVLPFLGLLLFSSGLTVVAVLVSDRRRARFKKKLLRLSKGNPLPQATFEKMLSESEF